MQISRVDEDRSNQNSQRNLQKASQNQPVRITLFKITRKSELSRLTDLICRSAILHCTTSILFCCIQVCSINYESIFFQKSVGLGDIHYLFKSKQKQSKYISMENKFLVPNQLLLSEIVTKRFQIMTKRNINIWFTEI